MNPGTDAPPALLDLRLLQLFDQLYRTRSVSRAAEQLGQAQPTVSIWLGRLRREIGDPLFVRVATGMEPTPRAEALIGTVRSALAMLQRLTAREDAFDPKTSKRRFCICMTDASHMTLLPQLLGRLRAIAPGMRLEAALINADTGRALRDGEADLALGFIQDLEAGFYQQSLYPQDWVCLANSDHPRIGTRLSLSAYSAEAHIAIAAGTGHRLLDEALAAHRVERRVMLELPGFLGLAAVVSATDLIATLPRHTGETLAAAAGLRVLPCPVPICSFTVRQYWHARYHHDPSNRWLRGVCATLFQLRSGRADKAVSIAGSEESKGSGGELRLRSPNQPKRGNRC